MIYAGIGARETPLPICNQMETLAAMLGVQGHTLRSGRATRPIDAEPDTGSADIAFETGARSVNGPMVIRTGTGWKPALDHAAQFHPAWENCDRRAREMHARNSLIMLGDKFDTPVDAVICWTRGAAVTGGTGQALRIAAAHDIPVFNLARDGADAQFWIWLAGR